MIIWLVDAVVDPPRVAHLVLVLLSVHVCYGSERYTNMHAALERWNEITPSPSSSIFSNSKKSHVHHHHHHHHHKSTEEEDATSVTSSCFSSLLLADSSDRSRSMRVSTTSLPQCLEGQDEEQEEESSNKGDDTMGANADLLHRTFHCHDNGELSKTSHRRSTLTTAILLPRDQDSEWLSSSDHQSSSTSSSNDDMDSMYDDDNDDDDDDDDDNSKDGSHNGSDSDTSSTIDHELEFLADCAAMYDCATDNAVVDGGDSCQGEEMQVEDLVVDAKSSALNLEGSDRWSDDGMDNSDDAPKMPLPMPPLIPVDRSNTPTHFLGRRYSHQGGLLDDVGSMHSQSTDGSLSNEDLLLEPSLFKPRTSLTSSTTGSGNRNKRASAMKHPGDSCSTWSTWASPCEDIDVSFHSGLAFSSLDDMSSHHLRPNAASNHAGNMHRHPIPQHGSCSSLKYPLPKDVVDGFMHVKHHRRPEKRLGTSLRDRFTDDAGAGKDLVASVPRRYSDDDESSSDNESDSDSDEEDFANDDDDSNHSSKSSVDHSPGRWQPHHHVSFQETLGSEANVSRITTMSWSNTDTETATGDSAMDMSTKWSNRDTPNHATGDCAMDMSSISYDQPPSFPARLPSGESPPRYPSTTEIDSSPPSRLVVTLSPKISKDTTVHVVPLDLSSTQPFRLEEVRWVVSSSTQETMMLGEGQHILQTSDLQQEPKLLLNNLANAVHSPRPALVSPGATPPKIPARNNSAYHDDCSGSANSTMTLLKLTQGSPRSPSSRRDLNSCRRAIVLKSSSDMSPVAPVRINTSDHGQASTGKENDELQAVPLKAASKKLAMRRSTTGEDLPGLVAFHASTSVPCIGTAAFESAKENFHHVDAPTVVSHGVFSRTTDTEAAPLPPSMTWKGPGAVTVSKKHGNHHEALASFRKRTRGHALVPDGQQQTAARNLSGTQQGPFPTSPTISVATQALGIADSKTPTQEAVVAVITPCAPHKKQPRCPLSQESDEDVSQASGESPSQQLRPKLSRAFSWSSMKLAARQVETPDAKKTSAKVNVDLATPNQVDAVRVPHSPEALSMTSSSTEKTKNHSVAPERNSVVARDGMFSLPNGRNVSSIALTRSLMDHLPRHNTKTTSGRPCLFFHGSEGIATFRELFFGDDTHDDTIVAFGRSLEGESGIIRNLSLGQTDYRRCELVLQPNWQLHVHNTFVRWPNDPTDSWIMQLPHGKTGLWPGGTDPTRVVLCLSQLMDQLLQRSSISLDRELFHGFEAASCQLQVVKLTPHSFDSVGARMAFQLNLFNLMVRHALILKHDMAKGLIKVDWPKRQSGLAPFLASAISYNIGGEVYSALDVHNALLDGTDMLPGSVKPSRWNWSCCGSMAVAHSVDPTVLMCMTFGTASSPEITAADPTEFESYLQDAAKRFCRNHVNVRVGAFKTCTIQIPELFKWHRETFTGGARATPELIIKSILPYLPTEQLIALTDNARKWKIRYVKHDWKPRQLSHPMHATTSVLANRNSGDPEVSQPWRDMPTILEELRDSSSRSPQSSKGVRARRLSHQTSPIYQPAKPQIAAYSHLDVLTHRQGDRGDDGASIVSELTADFDCLSRRGQSSEEWEWGMGMWPRQPAQLP
jgi:Protein of unknown function, DUF547